MQISILTNQLEYCDPEEPMTHLQKNLVRRQMSQSQSELQSWSEVYDPYCWLKTGQQLECQLYGSEAGPQ